MAEPILNVGFIVGIINVDCRVMFVVQKADILSVDSIVVGGTKIENEHQRQGVLSTSAELEVISSTDIHQKISWRAEDTVFYFSQLPNVVEST